MNALAEAEMREHPLLFSAPMVQAVLDGRKTQTRRIVPVPEIEFYDGYAPNGDVRWSTRTQPTGTNVIRNRYGARGDRLWVKETWGLASTGGWTCDPCVTYRVDGVQRLVDPKQLIEAGYKHHDGWRPSIFMYRCLSRIDLEVTAVRVERLQTLTRDDAIAEGCPPQKWYRVDGGPEHWFKTLWNNLNGERATWKSNPWVWVVSFKRVRP